MSSLLSWVMHTYSTSLHFNFSRCTCYRVIQKGGQKCYKLSVSVQNNVSTLQKGGQCHSANLQINKEGRGCYKLSAQILQKGGQNQKCRTLTNSVYRMQISLKKGGQKCYTKSASVLTLLSVILRLRATICIGNHMD